MDKKGSSTIDFFCCRMSDESNLKKLEILDVISNSDHIPIALTLQTQHPVFQNEIVKKIVWNSKAEKKFYNKMLSITSPGIQENDVNRLNKLMAEAVTSAAENCNMYKTFKNKGGNGKPWFDLECKYAKREVRNKLKLWKKDFANKNLGDQFLMAKSNFKKLVELKKMTYEINRVNILKSTKNKRKFWNSLYFRKSKKKNKINKIGLDEWQSFIESMYSEKKSAEKEPIDNVCDDLDRDISIEEIRFAIKNTKNHKATGTDQIGYEFYKALPGNWLVFLKEFFNKILQTQETPEGWSEILLTMLHKKGDTSILGNYRPIALVNCLAKIFTGILKKRLDKWLIDHKIICEEQAGFRQGRGCRDNIFILDTLIKSNLAKKGGKLFVAFIDFVSAFPSLNQEILWNKMKKIGISDRFINICKTFYNYAAVSVVTPEGRTEFVRISKGVWQGETLSSSLFLMFINDLVEILINFDLRGSVISAGHEIQALGYADDYALFASSYIELVRKLRVLEWYCDQNCLELSVEKSKIMIFHKGNINYSKYKFSYKNQNIEIVKCFTYLGVLFSCSGLFNKYLNKIVSSANLAIASTTSLIRKKQNIQLGGNKSII